MPSRTPTTAMSNIPPSRITEADEQLHNLVDALQKAIKQGNTEEARNCAETLANHRVSLLIEWDPENPCAGPKDQEISIKVCVEDRELSGGFVMMKVKPSVKIWDLKKKMRREYGFPVEVQRWIIGKRVAQDRDSISKCGVKASGDTVFLYLLSASSVGLDREQFLKEADKTLVSPGNTSTLTEGGVSCQMGRTLSESSHAIFGPETAEDFPMPPAVGSLYSEEQVVPLFDDVAHDPLLNPSRPVGGSDMSGVGPGSIHMGSMLAGSTGNGNRQGQPSPPAASPVGWECPVCTLINVPTRPGCEACSTDRPPDYVPPDDYDIPASERERLNREAELERLAQELESQRLVQEERQRGINFQQLLEMDHLDLVPNDQAFDCPICFDIVSPGNGVILRECLHNFCRDCLAGQVQYSEDAVVRCPFQDDSYTCNSCLQDREIKALVEPDIYRRYLHRSLVTAESQASNSYHCKTADCPGWCLYEDNANFFRCPVCNKFNCLTCKAIHMGMNCRQYQEDLKIRAANDISARESQSMLERMMEKGDAMRCPTCSIILQKKEGCDWIQCSMCKTEICWVTKGPRWGPMGAGDMSGGCMCRVNGQKCHPCCNNCH